MKNLRIEKYMVGMVQTNCYLAINTVTNEAIIVDPGDQANMLIEKITENNVKPVGILLTHGHFDHILAVEEVSKKYGISIFAHEEEQDVLSQTSLNLSSMGGQLLEFKADVLLKDKEKISLAGFEITVIHTPGHTKGGVCYYFEDEEVLFSGDTLFQESIGRTDFPTGNPQELVASVKNKLAVLPGGVQVYPGHEGKTTIEHEKQYNPFLA